MSTNMPGGLATTSFTTVTSTTSSPVWQAAPPNYWNTPVIWPQPTPLAAPQGHYYWGSAPNSPLNNILSRYNLCQVEDYIDLPGNKSVENILYIIPINEMTTYSNITYDRLSTNYITFIENDLDGKLLTSTQLHDFMGTGRSLVVLAYDTILNRLELSLVHSNEPRSNIDMLLDDKLQVKKDKQEYFNSLTSRFLPIVNFNFAGQDTDNLLRFEKNLRSGLFPIIHVANYLYNFTTPKKSTTAIKLLDMLQTEAILVDKTHLPQVQPNFSPEFGYLSLQNKEIIEAELKKFDKSKSGLINMLQNISVAGTNVLPFIDCLISQCALDQSILNIEEYTYCKIRHLLETNI